VADKAEILEPSALAVLRRIADALETISATMTSPQPPRLTASEWRAKHAPRFAGRVSLPEPEGVQWEA
jgi:hypothetical protein